MSVITTHLLVMIFIKINFISELDDSFFFSVHSVLFSFHSGNYVFCVKQNLYFDQLLLLYGIVVIVVHIVTIDIVFVC